MNLVSAASFVTHALPPQVAVVRLWTGLTTALAASTTTAARVAVRMADLRDIQRTLKGDSEAFKRLIERYQQHVAGILWKFTRDHRVHDELAQDVFVEMYLSLRTYKGKAPLSHWLARIATRIGYRFWKEKQSRSRDESFSLTEWDGALMDGQQRIDPSEAARVLYELLAQLAPRDRLVLTLRYLEECDIEETARRTGWSKPMVKVQSLRARKKLRKLFEKAGWEVTL